MLVLLLAHVATAYNMTKLNVTNYTGTCDSPRLADSLVMANSGCRWAIAGEVREFNTQGPLVSTFTDDCTAWNPSDLFFMNSDSGAQFLRTDQATFAMFGNVFRFRDCHDAMFAWAKTKFWSWRIEYDVYDAEDEPIMKSVSKSFWDVEMVFTDPFDEFVGVAFMSWSRRMAQGWFCDGGHYEFTFNPSAPPRYREIIVALSAVKAVRDQTRNSDGDVTGSWCHGFYKFLIVGLPILSCLLCCVGCAGAHQAYIRRARGGDRRSSARGSRGMVEFVGASADLPSTKL